MTLDINYFKQELIKEKDRLEKEQKKLEMKLLKKYLNQCLIPLQKT